ncbi:helix-turn-helix domain-containing protein [Candidatus Omnitrophota bacterium]
MEPTNRYLTESEVSELTSFALSTLRNARFNREGIPYCKIGRSVRYRLNDVVEFMDSHRIETAGCIAE